MKRYSKYVFSSEPWITEIPANWDFVKIKHLFKERSQKGFPNEVLLVSSQNMGVDPKSVYGQRTVEVQKDFQLLKLVCIGDFVVSLHSFQGGLEYAYYRGILSPTYTIMTPNDENNSPYFCYLFKCSDFISLLKLCVTGIREGQNIDYQKLKNFHIPVPPHHEQDQIVRFLDWKVSSINKCYLTRKTRKREIPKNSEKTRLTAKKTLTANGFTRFQNGYGEFHS